MQTITNQATIRPITKVTKNNLHLKIKPPKNLERIPSLREIEDLFRARSLNFWGRRRQGRNVTA